MFNGFGSLGPLRTGIHIVRGAFPGSDGRPCQGTGGRTSSWTCQFLWPAGCSVRRTVLNTNGRGVVEPPGNRRASPHLRWGTELQVNCRPFDPHLDNHDEKVDSQVVPAPNERANGWINPDVQS